MKPSHTSTPRQLSDCSFTVGHPGIERRGHATALLLSVVGLCVMAGLLIAGVL